MTEKLKQEKRKIVVIDDDIMARKIAYKALESSYLVYLVSNVNEALRICEIQNPDIILLDLIMPHVDGYEMLQLLKNNPQLCDIPVICMSATDNRENRERARSYGGEGFIIKPLSVKTLPKDIESILSSNTNTIKAKNNRIKFTTAFNEVEKDKILKNTITSLCNQNESVILLSWYRGEDFLAEEEFLQKAVDNEQLIYLEIKPSIISKFPYLHDLAPVIRDVFNFLNKDPRKCCFVFDEPRNLLNVHNGDKSISQAYNLSQAIGSEFKNIHYINSKSHNEKEQQFQNKIGKILIGLK